MKRVVLLDPRNVLQWRIEAAFRELLRQCSKLFEWSVGSNRIRRMMFSIELGSLHSHMPWRPVLMIWPLLKFCGRTPPTARTDQLLLPQLMDACNREARSQARPIHSRARPEPGIEKHLWSVWQSPIKLPREPVPLVYSTPKYIRCRTLPFGRELLLTCACTHLQNDILMRLHLLRLLM